ncbi:response regulator transcription factor [Aquabacterium humicola]|uniref:response regulator transcription factor n=1 Tax=Aquabacterium humicola TaxID=3237377 RepID=UPI002542FA7A|nr:response regulator transcription factor [Rubrivivax pictus]
MNDDKRILVIEDNDEIGELVQMHLATLGCRVKRVADGVTGLHEAQHGGHDLVVLDLMLPGLDGLEICRRLRGAQCRVAILMLSAKSAELERVLGLELGADDYLGKPFSVLELLARAKALLRRVATPAAPAAAAAPAARAIEVGPLRIDVDRRDVRIDGQRIDLTAKEFDLLTCFARSPGRVMTRMQLLQQVWGYSHSGYEHTVNTHINRLRAKIERDPNRPEIIETVWGVGYRCHDPRELRATSPA